MWSVKRPSALCRILPIRNTPLFGLPNKVLRFVGVLEALCLPYKRSVMMSTLLISLNFSCPLWPVTESKVPSQLRTQKGLMSESCKNNMPVRTMFLFDLPWDRTCPLQAQATPRQGKSRKRGKITHLPFLAPPPKIGEAY